MKRILPLLLLVTFFMPLSGCQYFESGDDPAGRDADAKTKPRPVRVKGEPMLQPAPIDIKGLDKDKVSKAVFAGIESRGFIFDSGTKTSMQVSWVRGRYKATWNVDYAGDNVTIKYADSVELDYNEDGEGNPYIHRTYNAWTTSLRGDIAREVGKLKFAS